MKESHEQIVGEIFQFLRSLMPVAKVTYLAAICVLAFLVRIFSVIRFESVIHEFDPWFNYRTTKFLTDKGWYDFWNWYDSESWYPLGRVIGGTIYPGLMGTAATFKWSMDILSLPMDIRNICVFLAPSFAGLTAISCYFFTKEATNKPGAGLLAALFISIVPSYISRSVAGSYDNEAVAIFALVNTFFLWIKACNTGSIMWAVACTLQYFYMVAAWGGYSFIINVIPIFVVSVMFANQFNFKIYIAYSVFYVLGTMLAMTIPFVTFNAIKSSEHLASHAVFFAMNAYVLVEYMRKNLPTQQFAGLIKIGMAFSMLTAAFGFVYLTFSGNTKWSGRSMTLLDPSYAKKYIPIIASVSEHQPTVWTNYFFDMGYCIMFLPMGYYFCLIENVTHGKLFIGIYGVLATYFSCVMIRLMLTLAPVVCIIAAISINEVLERAGASIRQSMLQLSWDVSDSSLDKSPAPAISNTSSGKGKSNKDKNKEANSPSHEKVNSAERLRRSKLLPLIPAGLIVGVLTMVM
jgi:dolichyl-diphosphooligosaccharide--protein glycosyltransferase